uniref:RAB34, member RAS oncogene family a n=1 Tax=Oryzias latipes TaxID=8090 RepID=A0A3P9I1W3_ORYLA
MISVGQSGSGLLLGSARMLSIRTTRQQSVWTLRWSASRCWVFLSACSCTSPRRSRLNKQNKAGVVLVAHCPLCALQVGHRGSGEVQVHRFYLLQRSSGYGRRFPWLTKICITSSNHIFLPTVVVIVFDLNDIASLDHSRQWLEDALKENDPTSVQLFLVGTKKDLSSPAQYSLIEQDALRLAKEIHAEYWAVSSLTGENVREFFFRLASLAFETNVLAELEKSGSRQIGDVVRINSTSSNLYASSKKKQPNCCQ